MSTLMDVINSDVKKPQVIGLPIPDKSQWEVYVYAPVAVNPTRGKQQTEMKWFFWGKYFGELRARDAASAAILHQSGVQGVRLEKTH